MILLRTLFLFGLLSIPGLGCHAQLVKTIDCPAGRVHVDTREPRSGGEEYCKLWLPGSLEVRDGPYRFWFNPEFEGTRGSYKLGREFGKWKECDRFYHCEQKDYPELDPGEKQRPGVKPVIPIAYRNGKYAFDFASCRETETEHTEGYVTEIRIGSQQDGCSYIYDTTDDVEYQDDLLGLQSGRQKQSFICMIPFQVGTRAFDSLDLMRELPKQGLPQYCRKESLPLYPPLPVDVTPTWREGAASVFTATYDAGDNGAAILQVRLHFQESATSRSNRCVVRYDPKSMSLYLNSDEPGRYLGPIAAGGNASLFNKECFLAGCSSAQMSGKTTLTVKFAIRFNPDYFSGTHRLFMELVDTQKHVPTADSGGWTVPAVQAESPAAPWPSDRSCPASPTGPL